VLTKASAADFDTGWAAAAGGPTYADISPVTMPSGWSAVAGIVQDASASVLTGSSNLRFSQTPINGWQEYQVTLAAGTYTISAWMVRNNSYGVVTFSIDGVDLATTWEGYAAGVSTTKLVITGVVVPTSATHAWRLRSASKHPSSSGYYWAHAGFQFLRTGA
jgi:hypothetical protein